MQALSENDVTDAVSLAERAARAAGRLLIEYKEKWRQVDSQVGRDIKLRADREAESIILDALRAEYDYPILSEETSCIGALGMRELYWVVDPLDGTFNYFRDLPLCCVSIALCEGREPLFGCIFDFNRDEMFTGGRAVPFCLNGVPVASKPAEMILATGLPKKGDFSARRLESFGPHVATWTQVRMIGSAALSLAWVAAGRFDAYEEAGILWWDVAAGVALVQSVGGRVSVNGDVIGGILNVGAYRQPLSAG